MLNNFISSKNKLMYSQKYQNIENLILKQILSVFEY